MTAKNDDDIRPMSPEEIKAIGEIELGPSKHEIFLNQHYKKLMWGGICLAVIAGSLIAYFSHRNDMRSEAAALVVESLNPAGKPAQNMQFDATSLEQLERDFASTPAASTGHLMRGLLLLRGDKPEEGVTYLREHVINAEDNTLTAPRAMAAIAMQYVRDGKTKEALAAWQELADMAGHGYRALAFLNVGDLSLDLGDKDAARRAYTRAKTECSSSRLVTQGTVEQRLVMMEVDAPKRVKPQPAEAPAESPAPTGNPFATPASDSPFGGLTTPFGNK